MHRPVLPLASNTAVPTPTAGPAARGGRAVSVEMSAIVLQLLNQKILGHDWPCSHSVAGKAAASQ
jgi:hypothetical protein